ncbi:uncharacterized protein (DUF2236 family) [Antricoccus suffuscus]|uniref:Uncharacterized protein (DUF2236 family) n=1 Tax=Antricoccus suffuscus TaxID=1629062 RepID=A0A2T1A1M9_9ACTN|nr:oxygenase MpaB family protein [Antricoccus suffuscus]PRZ42434.1 uncharacterized protein (DUF2236 family) [Antricoccus suffuscus]
MNTDTVRTILAQALRSRVVGDDPSEAARNVWATPGPRWYAEDAVIRAVHQDAAMFIGGIRALLLQSLHPLAMAGVAGHSGYRGDPWGRLQRTSAFIAMTTFGPEPLAEELIAKVREIHRRVRGVSEDGRRYSANDPRLLMWIHLAEVDSFLTAYKKYGAGRITAAQCDEYVDEAALVAAKVGVIDPPRTYADVRRGLDAYRPQLHATREARDTARFLLIDPPLPLAARPGYAMLATAAVTSLPYWARRHFWIPRIPVAEPLVGRVAGQVATRAIRWAMSAPLPGQ